MGNLCTGCDRGDIKNDFDIDGELGYDSDGVEEDFQHHKGKAKYNNIKHNMYDLIYRRACYPLYLIKIEDTWKQLDDLVETC